MIIGGGKELFLKGSWFKLDLFPDNTGHSDWLAFFTLSNSRGDKRITATEAIAFLKGEKVNPSMRIIEFVLMYPLPGCEPGSRVVERHSPRGIGVKISPSKWFPGPTSDMPQVPEEHDKTHKAK
jgi:hypothetical protein